MSQATLEPMPDRSPSEKTDTLRDVLFDDRDGSNRYRIAAVLISMIGIVASFVINEKGTTVFNLTSSLMLLFSILPPTKVPLAKLSFWSKTIFILMRGLRRLFQYGDRYVRTLIVYLCVGGSALTCKYGILHFSLLPRYADVIFKRTGPGLLLAALIFYPASLLSKKIFRMSERQSDLLLRRYELLFYLSSCLYCFTIFVSFCLFKVEDFIPSNSSFPTSLPGFGLDQISTLWFISLIWFLWTVGYGACIFSRFNEKALREDIE